MNLLRISLPAILGLFLGACASSPDVRFYTLRTVSTEIAVDTDAKVIGLGPILFPEYLKRPQIVTRKAGNALNIAEFERWAEPIEHSFPRILASNVDGMLDNSVVMVFPYGTSIDVDVRVIGRVFRFDADETGTAVMDVQWAARDINGDVLVSPRRTHYEFQATHPNDYNSIVGALNKTVDAFSADIAAALSP